MTARVPYVGADPVFARVEAMGRPVLNLYRALANQPAALDAFLDMSRYVRSGSSLDAGLRELVILATAHELGQDYEVAHRRVRALDGPDPHVRRRDIRAAEVAVLDRADRGPRHDRRLVSPVRGDPGLAADRARKRLVVKH